MLCAYPALAEAAVFGLPDPHWGEVVTVAIVMRPGATVDARDLRQRARSHIAGYKPPKAIDMMETLPLNATGKVDKRQLQRMDGAPLVAV